MLWLAQINLFTMSNMSETMRPRGPENFGFSMDKKPIKETMRPPDIQAEKAKLAEMTESDIEQALDNLEAKPEPAKHETQPVQRQTVPYGGETGVSFEQYRDQVLREAYPEEKPPEINDEDVDTAFKNLQIPEKK